ncbi:unnamed protein product [Diplocarpon coronariae]|uniref:U6 snRNA-associated Sm-like protein LSm1 n=1 Tax=Diplocarpon coronariae TaxID=2795749 RepID=A0A218YZR0_9HELO|nr:hypothetical protein JHW43_003076 [Diplocarpon mali]OWP00545.1 hypothetical protein B2J93_4294 [Marssonina coronariae]
MENLTLYEQPGAQPQQMPSLRPSPPIQQLPPQMFTTAAQLLDMTDKKLMVALRDGRKLIGVLRSWDQFANLVLQSTTERIFVPPSANSTSPPTKSGEIFQPGLYADVPRGIFLVRGENVLLLGEIDLDKDDDPPPGYEKAEVELVHRLSKERKAKEASREKFRTSKLRALGFEGETTGEASI